MKPDITQDWQVIFVSTVSNSYGMPTKIVVRKNPNNIFTPYAVHTQVKYKDGTITYIVGKYYDRLGLAAIDFNDRCALNSVVLDREMYELTRSFSAKGSHDTAK